MSIYTMYQTDKEKETKGVMIPFPANDDGSIPSFCLARSGNYNKRYQKVLTHDAKPYQRQIQLDVFPDADAEKLYLGVFAKTVLIGWENVQDKDGKNITYSSDAVIALMTELPELYAELQAKAKGAALFKVAELEDAAKNL